MRRTRRSSGEDTTGSASIDEAEGLVGGVRGERRRGCLDGEPRRAGVVACGERVAREHRQALGRRLAALQQQVDDGCVDLAPPPGRELVQRELANLLVGERVVGRVVLGMLVEQARVDRRSEDGGEVVRKRPRRAFPDGTQVAHAEAPAEHAGVAEERQRVLRQPRGPARDQRPDRRGHESRRVPPEPPLPVDQLERAGIAMGPRELLDDERHAFGLGMHRGDRLPLDRAAEHLAQQLAGLDRREPPDAEPPDKAHPLHVGDEVDRLGHGRELVRPERQEQEDRAVRDAPDDVPKEAQGVVVGPLDVVDEQGDRPDAGQLPDGDAREVEGAQQPGVGQEALVAGLVAARDRVDDPAEGQLGGGALGGLAQRAVREQAASDEERPADLLVRGDRDGREAGLGGDLRGGNEEARLADPWLALERHGGESGARLADLLRDRGALRRAADDRAGRASKLHGQRALRLDEGIERVALDHSECGHLEGIMPPERRRPEQLARAGERITSSVVLARRRALTQQGTTASTVKPWATTAGSDVNWTEPVLVGMHGDVTSLFDVPV